MVQTLKQNTKIVIVQVPGFEGALIPLITPSSYSFVRVKEFLP